MRKAGAASPAHIYGTDVHRREWLEWLTRVRLLMIALILGVGVCGRSMCRPAVAALLPAHHHSVDYHSASCTCPGAFAAATFWFGGDFRVVCDLVGMITGGIPIFTPRDCRTATSPRLYLLVMSSSPASCSRGGWRSSNRRLLCLASLALVLFLWTLGGCHELRSRLLRGDAAVVVSEAIRLDFSRWLFGEPAGVYPCAAKVRNWNRKREELLELQDFTADVIHSMRGGLVTTDMEGRVC